MISVERVNLLRSYRCLGGLLALISCVAGQAEIRLGVDWNGDGYIQTTADERVPQDVATADQPFTFWLNHDQDDVESGGETWPIARADSETRQQDSVRDLEDFTRLQIEIDDLGSLPRNAVLKLSWTGGSSPQINLFRNADAACSLAYLLDLEMGQQQLIEVTEEINHG